MENSPIVQRCFVSTSGCTTEERPFSLLSPVHPLLPPSGFTHTSLSPSPRTTSRKFQDRLRKEAEQTGITQGVIPASLRRHFPGENYCRLGCEISAPPWLNYRLLRRWNIASIHYYPLSKIHGYGTKSPALICEMFLEYGIRTSEDRFQRSFSALGYSLHRNCNILYGKIAVST